MTYEEKKAWLSRYREAEKLYQRLSYRLAEAQEATRHITQNLSAAPGGSKDGQSLARAIERKAALEQEAAALRGQKKQYYKEIFDTLSRSVQDPIDHQILHKRYLECKSWEKIAADMNFALRWVYARHHRAVETMEL